MASREARDLYERIVQLPESERRTIFCDATNEMKAGLWIVQLEDVLANDQGLTAEQRAFLEEWIERISAPNWFALDARNPERREELRRFELAALALFPREVAGRMFQHLGPPDCGLPTSRRRPETPE